MADIMAVMNALPASTPCPIAAAVVGYYYPSAVETG